MFKMPSSFLGRIKNRYHYRHHRTSYHFLGEGIRSNQVFACLHEDPDKPCLIDSYHSYLPLQLAREASGLFRIVTAIFSAVF